MLEQKRLARDSLFKIHGCDLLLSGAPGPTDDGPSVVTLEIEEAVKLQLPIYPVSGEGKHW